MKTTADQLTRRTGLNLDMAVYKRVKAAAVARDITVTEALHESMELWLTAHEKGPRR